MGAPVGVVVGVGVVCGEGCVMWWGVLLLGWGCVVSCGIGCPSVLLCLGLCRVCLEVFLLVHSGRVRARLGIGIGRVLLGSRSIRN